VQKWHIVPATGLQSHPGSTNPLTFDFSIPFSRDRSLPLAGLADGGVTRMHGSPVASGRRILELIVVVNI
jgi:hypothetical protein